jgi:hypothetical protein
LYKQHLWDTFPIQIDLKQDETLSPLLYNFTLEGSRNPSMTENEWGTTVSGLC